jgi:hypothetical protein
VQVNPETQVVPPVQFVPPHCPYAATTEVDVGLLEDEVEVDVLEVVVELVLVLFVVVLLVLVVFVVVELVLVLLVVVDVDVAVDDVGGAAPAISP